MKSGLAVQWQGCVYWARVFGGGTSRAAFGETFATAIVGAAIAKATSRGGVQEAGVA